MKEEEAVVEYRIRVERGKRKNERSDLNRLLESFKRSVKHTRMLELPSSICGFSLMVTGQSMRYCLSKG
jgi:hypothetical protein